MLYGILLDRMSLSAKNGWIDKNGRVYIIFTIDEAKMALNCAEQKAIKLLSELEKKAGLIERKRQGLGKPNLIYVKNFISAVDKRKMKKLLILNLPYFLVGLFATNLGEAWRLAEGADSSAKILSFFHALPIALNNPFPSFHPLDLLIGILCGAGLRLAVYLKGKNAKKYRHNVEYGSARWSA